VRLNKLYSVHPGVLMMQKWVDTLQAKTGRSLEEWVRLIRKDGPPTTKERLAWLKHSHQLGTNYAKTLVEQAELRGQEEIDAEAYLRAAPKWVDEMFSGKKAALRPIYDRLLELGLSLGPDVQVSPSKTIVPFYRNHVFAQVKPSTQTRVDLGLCLRGEKPGRRLEDTGGEKKGDRITHRIGISSTGEIDKEVEDWMRKAYEADA
jgi:Domain of unknown function (DUF5655)/Domain of unknown function (DUF4287)